MGWLAGGCVYQRERRNRSSPARAAVATANKGGETQARGEGTHREQQARKMKGKETLAPSPGAWSSFSSVKWDFRFSDSPRSLPKVTTVALNRVD